MTVIIQFVLVMFLMVMALWRRTSLWYIVSGFAWLLYGFMNHATLGYFTILVVIVGLFNFAGAKLDR